MYLGWKFPPRIEKTERFHPPKIRFCRPFENYNFPHLILKENFILTVESILDDYINLYRKLEIMKLYKLSNKSKDGVILILNFLDKMINNIKNDKFSIELEKKVYLDDGDIFEYSVTKHVYEHFVFETIFVNN